MSLTRLATVDVSVALDLAGTEPDVFDVGRSTVAVGAAAVVIIGDAADDPAAGGVWNDQEFRLRGLTPAVAASRLTGRESLAGLEPDLDRPVHLFVRVDGLAVYIGPVRHSRSTWTNGELNSCHLRIEPPLSRELLDTVRPPTAVPLSPGLDWLGSVRTDPGRALESFVTGWFPAQPETRPTDIAIPGSVPYALADFYRLAEKRPAILGGQNFIQPLTRLSTDIRGERLVVATENQGCWDWSIPWQLDAASTDPDVWLTEDDAPAREEEPLSRFLLQFSLYEASMTAPYQAFLRNLPEQLLSELEACLHRVPLRPFLAPIGPTNFLVAPGLVAHISPELNSSNESDVWIGALHRSALRPLSRLQLPWRRFDG
ncbi:MULTISPECIES: hypothetical protein [Streptomyces]|uniref:hypothetical protein n=1 Tax=Streptomyces TaxID=1883 RepID=UPI00281194B2|nr:hypothetical protein [Streptomyces sp.]